VCSLFFVSYLVPPFQVYLEWRFILPDYMRLKTKPAKKILAPYQSAQDAIGTIEKGFRLFGFSKGQFSLIDLIRALLEQTGAADVVVSTWTTGIRDAENANALMEKGTIRSLLLLTDRSFPTRKPEYCQRILEVFGAESIRCTYTHAKFAIIQNDKWDIAIRSSMNLNRNPRYEQFDIDDDAELCAFIRAHVEECFDVLPHGLKPHNKTIVAAFANSLGGGLSKDGDFAEFGSFDSDWLK